MKLLAFSMAAALAVAPGLAAAQAPAKAPARPAAKAAVPSADTPPLPSEAELKAATDLLSVFVSALNAKELPADLKAGLMLCLYANPLGKISLGEAKVFAANKDLDSSKPTVRLRVLAAICHAPFPVPAAAGQPK